MTQINEDLERLTKSNFLLKFTPEEIQSIQYLMIGQTEGVTIISPKKSNIQSYI